MTVVSVNSTTSAQGGSQTKQYHFDVWRRATSGLELKSAKDRFFH